MAVLFKLERNPFNVEPQALWRAFQMKGLGSRFQCCAQVVIASDSSAMYLQPGLMALWAGVRTSRPECTVVVSVRGSDPSARVAEMVE